MLSWVDPRGATQQQQQEQQQQQQQSNFDSEQVGGGEITKLRT